MLCLSINCSSYQRKACFIDTLGGERLFNLNPMLSLFRLQPFSWSFIKDTYDCSPPSPIKQTCNSRKVRGSKDIVLTLKWPCMQQKINRISQRNRSGWFSVALIKDGVRERDSFSRADEFPASGLSRFINSYFIRKKNVCRYGRAMNAGHDGLQTSTTLICRRKIQQRFCFHPATYTPFSNLLVNHRVNVITYG